jgi:hypothetical protein
MSVWPRSLDLVNHPGMLEGTLWVWFGPLSPRAVRVWTIVLAATVAVVSGGAGALVVAALAEAGWVAVVLVFPAVAFLSFSLALLAALRLFRGRPEVFRITRNQVRLGRFVLPLDAIRAVEVQQRPERLQSLGLRVDSEIGELWLEVNPFAHSLADLQWLADRLVEGPPTAQRDEVPEPLLQMIAQ